jgi:YHS domain-containing protein
LTGVVTAEASPVEQGRASGNRATGGWRTDFAEALEEAKRLNRPLLIHFHATWCMPCRKMEHEFLDSPELFAQLGEKVVAVKVDADQRADLVERFEVHRLPSDVFLDPQGAILARTIGYQDRQTYFGKLARVDMLWAEQSKLHIARHGGATGASGPGRPGPGLPNGVQKPAEGGTRNSDAEPGRATVTGVGLDGFSPVALYLERKWLRGDAVFASEHKGVVYHLASAEELAYFRAEPEKYAPQLMGCDPVIAWETDRAVAGSTQFGAYFQGELFLFVNADTRSRFKEHPGRYARIRHVLRDEQVQETATR